MSHRRSNLIAPKRRSIRQQAALDAVSRYHTRMQNAHLRAMLSAGTRKELEDLLDSELSNNLQLRWENASDELKQCFAGSDLIDFVIPEALRVLWQKQYLYDEVIRLRQILNSREGVK
jgi:hypothetical protein